MTTVTRFTRGLQSHLANIGYTHILSIGNRNSETNIHYLCPLKANDERLQSKEGIYTINSDEVFTMADKNDTFSFYIEVSENELEKYTV